MDFLFKLWPSMNTSTPAITTSTKTPQQDHTLPRTETQTQNNDNSLTRTPSPLTPTNMSSSELNDYNFTSSSRVLPPGETPQDTVLPPLSDLLFSFIHTINVFPLQQGRSHAHSGLANAYIIARALQVFIPVSGGKSHSKNASSSTPQLDTAASVKRGNAEPIELRKLALKLHLVPNTTATQEALQALELLGKYIEDVMKAEMDHIKKSVPPSKWFPVTTDEQEFLGMLGKIKYQAGVTLPMLIKSVRAAILAKELLARSEEEEHEFDENVGLSTTNLKPFGIFEGANSTTSPFSTIDRTANLSATQPNTTLTPQRISAFRAVENYRHTANICAEDLLSMINDDLSGAAGLKRGVSKVADIQEAFGSMAAKLEQLLNAEKAMEEVD
ncbi:hypothetical protein B0J14DRAFT_645937 [Halenospora varia]|nr:hypothetical protein B0J14DRAFT_645937 [Halenospora varia]